MTIGQPLDTSLEDEYKVIAEAEGTATVTILNNNTYRFVIKIPAKDGKDLFISKSYTLNDIIKKGIENAVNKTD